MEQNCNGAMDTAYVYGAGRASLDRFDGSTGYYLYDGRGSVTGITNGEGQVCLSYRYGAFGEITYGAPKYENIYAYNGESYNPNVGEPVFKGKVLSYSNRVILYGRQLPWGHQGAAYVKQVCVLYGEPGELQGPERAYHAW